MLRHDTIHVCLIHTYFVLLVNQRVLKIYESVDKTGISINAMSCIQVPPAYNSSSATEEF